MNKKITSNEFHDSIERQLSGLKPDPWLAQRIMASEKEEEPVAKKISLSFVLVVALICISVAALAAGIVTWSRGMEDALQVTDDIKESFQGTNLFDAPEMSVTHNGVTVTLHQSIVDTSAAFISFRVTGYKPQEGKHPGFDEESVSISEIDGLSWGYGGRFFDGLVVGPDGKGIFTDGSIPTDFDNLPYANEQGEMFYIIKISTDEENFSFVGKTIHVSLKNLGVYAAGKAGDLITDVEESWDFEWELKGVEDRVEMNDLSIPIGKTGATLIYLRLSPVHVYMLMDLPQNQEAPFFRGVKWKDGTVYDLISGGGADGYLNEESTTYKEMFALERIIVPEQIESLLFTDLRDESIVEVKIQ